MLRHRDLKKNNDLPALFELAARIAPGRDAYELRKVAFGDEKLEVDGTGQQKLFVFTTIPFNEL